VRLVVVARADFTLAETESKHTDILTVLLISTFALTIWQARWSYFFVMISQCSFRKSYPFCATADCRNCFHRCIVSDCRKHGSRVCRRELARRAENKIEQLELRAISSQIDGPFIAPWWLSPTLSYWSRQPGVAGVRMRASKGSSKPRKFSKRMMRKKHDKYLIYIMLAG